MVSKLRRPLRRISLASAHAQACYTQVRIISVTVVKYIYKQSEPACSCVYEHEHVFIVTNDDALAPISSAITV